jgi:hypothetical protein
LEFDHHPQEHGDKFGYMTRYESKNNNKILFIFWLLTENLLHKSGELGPFLSLRT